MKTLHLLLVGVLLSTWAPAALAADDGCVSCHRDEEMTDRGRRPAELFAGDAHDRVGIGCTACHGGDGGETDFMKAHRREAGFRGKVRAPATPELCAECHDDEEKMRSFGVEAPEVGQGSRFRTSVHGRLRPREGFEAPNCASCHGAHGIRPSDEPESSVHPSRVPETCNRCHGDLAYMRAFTSARVRVDQLIEYRTSVHGERLAKGDTKVAVCSSCHGNHEILPATNVGSRVHPLRVAATCAECHADPEHMKGYEVPARGGGTRPIDITQFDRYRQSIHHAAIAERGDFSAPTCNDCHGNHGATPPEVRAVATICAQCHTKPEELFSASSLREELAEAGRPGCATCHGHHEVRHPGQALLEQIAGGTTPSGWAPSEELRAVAAEFLSKLVSLETAITEVEADVRRAENYGLDLTRAHLQLNHARDQLVRARVAVHSFSTEQLRIFMEGSEDEPGGLAYLSRARSAVENALADRSFRRKGLAVALVIITVLIVALVLKIRRLEAEAPA